MTTDVSTKFGKFAWYFREFAQMASAIAVAHRIRDLQRRVTALEERLTWNSDI